MNAKNIMDALNGIDETLFDVSEEHVKKGGTVLSKWMAAVAAFAVVIFAGGILLPGLMHPGSEQEEESSRYREGVSVTAVLGMEDVHRTVPGNDTERCGLEDTHKDSE